MKLRELKETAAGKLAEAGIELPYLEVQVLFSRFLSLSKTRQILESEKEVEEADVRKVLSAVEERCSHTPLSYITGHREFYGLDFKVTPDTLIPRPDTEILVETALEFLNGRKDAKILDMCTGTGCAGIAAAANASVSSLTLCDISRKALECAKTNAKALLPPSLPVNFILSDLFENIGDRDFDVIISNPPYIRKDYLETLSPEVRKEPALALFDDDIDGLGLCRKIASSAAQHLVRGGLLAIECDYRQTSALSEIITQNGFTRVRIAKDLAGRERVVSGERE